MPYVATVEMALGRTQAGYAHLQAHTARVQAEQARLQAGMARQQLQEVWMNRDRFEVLDRRVTMPNIVVDVPNIRVNGPEHVMVCPRTRVRVAMPEVSTPKINIMQDPI